MRISRKKRPKKALIPRYNINKSIRAETIRLLDPDGEHLGIFSLDECLKKAREMEMDLVEINPKADPPICQILDFQFFKYRKEKEARKQRANAKTGEIKGIRLSIRIGVHDMEIRQKQAEKFLNRGDKVKIDVILKGSEKSKAYLAFETIQKFCDKIKENVSIKFEQEAQKQGHTVSATITKT